MSKVQMLRSLVHQRLTAAAEEIFGLFERTIAEYEEELSSSKEENERQRKLLDAVFNPEVRIQRADIQHLLVDKEEVPPEQQVWSSSLDQEDPEPPHIKEEQEELWTSQEGEQLQGLEEADIKFLFTPVPVKSENDEEEAQSSQLHQRQTEQTETEADGEDCGGPELDRHPGPDKISNSSETEDIDDGLKLWRETQSSCNALRHNEVSDAANKPFSCSESKVLVGMDRLQIHLKRHTGEKTFTCQFCGKVFTKNSNLKTHLRVHTGEKPFTCSVCNTSFSLRSTLVNHMRVHTGEKPFSCSVCSRRFSKKANLTAHVAVHTLEKPFKCSVCDKKFTWPSQVKNHKCMS